MADIFSRRLQVICCLYILQAKPLTALQELWGEKEVKHVANLNKVVSAFQSTHSLVILTAFRGVSFAELTYPIILRNLRPVFQFQSRREGWFVRRIAYPAGNARSTYWINLVDWRKTVYRVLKARMFCSKIKLWNGLVSISLFVPPQLWKVSDNYLAFLDYYVPPAEGIYNIFPSPVPLIRIFIVHHSEQLNSDFRSELATFINRRSADEYYRRVYLINTRYEIWYGVSDQIHIDSVHPIKMCRENHVPKLILEVINSETLADAINESVVLCNSNSKTNNLLYYFETSGVPDVQLILHMWHELHICGNYKIIEFREMLELKPVAVGYASVWRSIMGNFSYAIGYPYQVCDNGKSIPKKLTSLDFKIHLSIRSTFHKTDSSATLFYAVVSSVFNDMQFITCGYQGLEGLQFMQLLLVFKTNVWLALIISCFILVLVTHHFPTARQKLSITEGVLVPVKLLLEQSNPIPDSLIYNHRYMWISGTLLLMGIILSNAYKNTNVYNMIILRKSVPYRHLRELLNDGFTIYTRTERVDVDYPMLKLWWKNKIYMPVSVRELKGLRRHTSKHKLMLEVGLPAGYIIRQSELDIMHEIAVKIGVPPEMHNLTYLLYNHTSLLPVTMSLFQNIDERIQAAQGLSFDDVSVEYERNFFLEENAQILYSCAQTAVVLPTYTGYQLTKKSAASGYKNIYQGVETYYTTNLVFRMRGSVPQYLIKRAKYAERCGLWKRWQTLFKDRFARNLDPGNEPLRKPSLAGNIVIIFLLLLFGLISSLVSFGLEASLVDKVLSVLRPY